MAKAVDLLARGYFPRELPPPFNTHDFASLVAARSASLGRRSGATECVSHAVPRAGGLRRPLGIPNPRGFLLLAKEVERQWSMLSSHMAAQRLSCSRPILGRDADSRSLIPQLHLRELPTVRARRWPARRFLVHTDISQFYNSIYTHSIPWALHGKKYGKLHRDNCDGGKSDKVLRNLQSQQTSGIPIGPDTSLVVAEVLLAAVDQQLVSLANGRLRGHRYIDDYELVASSRDEAENVLGLLEGALFDFQLALNPYKTGIVELPHVVDAPWRSELATFPIRDVGAIAALTDTVAFFDRAVELSAAYPDDAVLKYALSRARSLPVGTPGWRTFEGLVLGLAAKDATAFPVAVDLLRSKAAQARTSIDKHLFCDVIEEMLVRHGRNRQMHEVAWCLWAAILLGLRLSKESGESVSRLADDVVAILALDARSRHCFPRGALDLTLWDDLASEPDALLREHWLVTYECGVRRWLPSARKALSADPFFKELARAPVHFYAYNPRRGVRPFSGPTAPLPGGLLPTHSV